MARRFQFYCFGAFCLIFMAVPLLYSQEPSPLPTATGLHKEVTEVSKVISGDTLLLKDGRIIKLAGVKCYEPFDFGWVDSINTDRQRLAREALQLTKNLVANQSIGLEFPYSLPKATEWYAAYVFLPDNRCLNELLLEEGLAQILTGMPDHPKHFHFKELQRIAKLENKGIWSIDFSKLTVFTGYEDTSSTSFTSSKQIDYSPPNIADDQESTESSGLFAGLLPLIVLLGGIGGIFASIYMIFRTQKTCPMCLAKISSREKVCSNCGYNFVTGYLGDPELQNWVTQNIRVRKTGKKKR
ncbi:thermonuclease family protein [bacterium]|nr:thermonuclease family protein [candidate division CSSED10-310 bacterium]